MKTTFSLAAVVFAASLMFVPSAYAQGGSQAGMDRADARADARGGESSRGESGSKGSGGSDRVGNDRKPAMGQMLLTDAAKRELQKIAEQHREHENDQGKRVDAVSDGKPDPGPAKSSEKEQKERGPGGRDR